MNANALLIHANRSTIKYFKMILCYLQLKIFSGSLWP